LEAFSQEWASLWCATLNGDLAYREAASGFTGRVGVVMSQSAAKGAPARTVLLDLAHGQCQGAKSLAGEAVDEADYVLAGTARAWQEVLGGRQNPLSALMTGKLRLTKGSLAALVPHSAMARELIRIAVGIPSSFSDDWV
jgi:putative sterol carrier protein